MHPYAGISDWFENFFSCYMASNIAKGIQLNFFSLASVSNLSTNFFETFGQLEMNMKMVQLNQYVNVF